MVPDLKELLLPRVRNGRAIGGLIDLTPLGHHAQGVQNVRHAAVVPGHIHHRGIRVYQLIGVRILYQVVGIPVHGHIVFDQEQQQLIAIGEYGIISVGPGGAALLGQDKLMGDIPLVHFLDRCPEKGSPGDQLLLQPIPHRNKGHHLCGVIGLRQGVGVGKHSLGLSLPPPAGGQNGLVGRAGGCGQQQDRR